MPPHSLTAARGTKTGACVYLHGCTVPDQQIGFYPAVDHLWSKKSAAWMEGAPAT
jgi:hypothetical protein